MTQRPILFSIRESTNFPRDLWERFEQRARDEGQSPVAVLRWLIERHLRGPDSAASTTIRDLADTLRDTAKETKP